MFFCGLLPPVCFFLDECFTPTSVIQSSKTGLYQMPIELMWAHANSILQKKSRRLSGVTVTARP